MKDSRFKRFADTCRNKGITQQNAFQTFITGAVTALSGLGTLLLLESNELSLQQEILALIAIFLTFAGLVVAGISYLLLLALRLSQSSDAPAKNHSENH